MSKKTEIECFDNVKKLLFPNFRKIDFYEKIKCYVDKTYLLNIFKSIHHSQDENKFPDFKFDGGILEHFIVTGTKERKGKGCDFKIKENINKKINDKYLRNEEEKLAKNPKEWRTISSITAKNIYNESSYSIFFNSFKKNFDKHVESLMKSKYNGKIIFLIEQQDGRMRIFENNIFNRFYLLSQDKKILQYLKEKQSFVNIVIYTCSDSVEIIDLSTIDALILKAADNLDIRGGRLLSITTQNFLCL